MWLVLLGFDLYNSVLFKYSVTKIPFFSEKRNKYGRVKVSHDSIGYCQHRGVGRLVVLTKGKLK